MAWYPDASGIHYLGNPIKRRCPPSLLIREDVTKLGGVMGPLIISSHGTGKVLQYCAGQRININMYLQGRLLYSILH
jgi:hypothetical protein